MVAYIPRSELVLYRSRGRIAGSGITGVSSFFDSPQFCRPVCRLTEISHGDSLHLISSFFMKVTFTFGMPRSESHGLHLQSLPLLNRPLPCLLSLRWERRWRPRSGRLLPGPWSWVPGLSGVGWRACETSILQLHTLIDLYVVSSCWMDQYAAPPPSYHIRCATDLHTQ